MLLTTLLLAFSLSLLSSVAENRETCDIEGRKSPDGECSEFISNEDEIVHSSTVEEAKATQSVTNNQGMETLDDGSISVSGGGASVGAKDKVTNKDSGLVQSMEAFKGEEGTPAVANNDTGEIHNVETLPGNSSNTTNNDHLLQEKTEEEFKCRFYWHEPVLKRLKVKIVEWIKEREKSFHRFIVPVMGFNSSLPSFGSNFTGVLTWVWYREKNKYMLHFPHNFISISLSTMGIITQDWALDYYNKSFMPSSLTLTGNGIDIDDGAYEYKRNLGYCDHKCLSVNQSCGLGKHEMVNLLTELGELAGGFEWDYLCLQLEYKDVHSVAQTGSHPNHLVPDLLYYAMFLRKLLAERWLGLPIVKDQFPQYHCYSKNDLSVVKSRELLENYFVIPGFLALLLWLYFPLLIHYLPSSSKEIDKITQVCPKGMFPTHKMPVYFGRCLKTLLCFYIEGDSIRIRLRRLIFLAVLFLSSFRLFCLPSYGVFFLCVAIVIILVCAYPAHISSRIDTAQVLDSNKRFAVFGWELWPGLIKVNPVLKEYQLLAAMMQERVYMFLDFDFWKFLAEMSFNGLSNSAGMAKWYLLLRGMFQFMFALAIYFLYYFVPLFYFVGEMTTAILRSSNQQVKLTSLLCRLVLFGAFIYSILVAYFWSCAIIEFSIFTLYGGVISPSMIFPYFVLVGSTVRTVYLLIHSLHEHYEEILDAIVEKLKSKDDFKPVAKLEKKIDDDAPSNYTVSLIDNSQSKIDLLRHAVPVMYISRKLYTYIVEKTSPVRRYVFFIIIQVIAIFIYAGIALSIKNVFHLEKQVGTIFQIISNVAVIFVPGILKFLAYKSHYGKKEKEVLKKNVYYAMIDYFSQQP